MQIVVTFFFSRPLRAIPFWFSPTKARLLKHDLHFHGNVGSVELKMGSPVRRSNGCYHAAKQFSLGGSQLYLALYMTHIGHDEPRQDHLEQTQQRASLTIISGFWGRLKVSDPQTLNHFESNLSLRCLFQ